MKNIDDFFGDDESQNVQTLIEVTKRFFGFVSQLAEIVDELSNSFNELSSKVDQLQRGGAAATSPSPTISSPGLSPPVLTTQSTSPPAPAATSVPSGLPAPPAPVTASTPPPSSPSPAAPPSVPSGLPPLPGLSTAPASPQPSFGQPPGPQPGLNPPPGPQPGFGQPPGPGAPAPRASPMSLKAQMNMELKEAFARIKKGWAEEDQ